MLPRLTTVCLILLLSACQQADETPAPATPPSEVETETPASQAQADEMDQRCELTMGWDPWEPYHFAGAGGRVQGLDIDIVSELGDRVDCQLEWVQGNWASLLRLLQAGELDMLPGATFTPEREQFAWFSDPYREERFALFVRSEEVDQWSDQALGSLLDGGFRIGVTQGYIYSGPIQALQSDSRYSGQFIEAPIGELNLHALLDYRIDGFLEDPFVVAAIQRRRSGSSEIDSLDLDFGSGEVHLLFSRQSVSQDLVQQFNEALEAMRTDGTYEDIMNRYKDS